MGETGRTVKHLLGAVLVGAVGGVILGALIGLIISDLLPWWDGRLVIGGLMALGGLVGIMANLRGEANESARDDW